MPRTQAPQKSEQQCPGHALRSVAAEELAQRIGAAPRLREHHLWEILRTLPSLAAARDDCDFRHRFRTLMERDDLEGASLLLVEAAQPKRRLDRLRSIDGNWVARILSTESAAPRAVAVHADRVAAILAALVSLDRSDSTAGKH